MLQNIRNRMFHQDLKTSFHKALFLYLHLNFAISNCKYSLCFSSLFKHGRMVRSAILETLSKGRVMRILLHDFFESFDDLLYS